MYSTLKKLLIIIAIITVGCEYPVITKDLIIYENDFESNDLKNIDGGIISNFNNTKLIGNYNNDGFTIHLENIEDHHYVYVSFDLYIHGSWDGNKNGFKDNDQADKWTMQINPGLNDFNPTDLETFETTFSNSPCFSNYCLRQSYPEMYPFDNNPKTGSASTGLPIICEAPGWNNVDTTLYKIEKGFNHRGNALIIRFFDNLYQPNAIDFFGNNIDKCDESWSLDNLKIRIITYN